MPCSRGDHDKWILVQYFVNGLISFALIVPVGLGFWLIFRTCGFFHFAYGASITAGAYLLFIFLKNGIHFTISIVVAIVISLVIGFIFEKVIFTLLRQHRASSLVNLVASLGLYSVVVNIIALYFGDHPKTVHTWPTIAGMSLLGATITQTQVSIILVSMLSMLCFWAIFRFSALGIRMEAVACDPYLARVVGIDVDRVYFWAMGLVSSLAGFAGIMTACDVEISPTMGMQPMLMGIVAVIVGGNTFWGTVCGAFLLGMARHLGVIWLPTQWQDAITFVILLIFLLLRPQGILGRPLIKAKV